MKISKKELLEALEIVKPGLASNDNIEQTTSFAFKDNRIYTYNDEISISHPVAIDVTGAVKAEELYKLLQKTKTEDIEIEEEENELLLKTGRTKAGLSFQSEIKMPLEEIDDGENWKELPPEFIEGLKFCKDSTSKDMTNAKLTCVHIRDDGAMEACDRYRLSWFKFADKFKLEEFLIPATTVQHLIRYPLESISQSDSWVHFKFEETVISCRVYAGEYPNTDATRNLQGEENKFPEELTSILDRAYVFSKRDVATEEVVHIDIEDGKVVVRAQNDFGWFEESVDINIVEDVSFSINPMYLKQILDKSSNFVLTENMIAFKGDNWEHTIMLMRKI